MGVAIAIATTPFRRMPTFISVRRERVFSSLMQFLLCGSLDVGDRAGPVSSTVATTAMQSRRSLPDRSWDVPATLLRQSGAPRSGRPAITIVRNASIADEVQDRSRRLWILLSPSLPQRGRMHRTSRRPAGHVQRRRVCWRHTTARSDRRACPPCDHSERMPLTRTSTCASVSMPPALRANAGIRVPWHSPLRSHCAGSRHRLVPGRPDWRDRWMDHSCPAHRGIPNSSADKSVAKSRSAPGRATSDPSARCTGQMATAKHQRG